MSLIVCEVGSNFRTLDHCIQSIGQAKALGADAVKFQMFSDADLYGYGSTEPRGIEPKWLPKLAEKAKASGIELMCTAFSPAGVAVVNEYVRTHKVASAEACCLELLLAVAQTGKPVYISTGGHSGGEMGMAVRFLRDHGSGPVTVLYCVGEYPTRRTDMRPLIEGDWWERIGADYWGFSDHSLDILGAPQQAAFEGAFVIEKHVTFFPDLETPDRPHSLTPGEFAEFVQGIEEAREPFELAAKRNQDAFVLRHNRRLIVTAPIAKGEVLRRGKNYGAYRSRADDIGALPPWADVNDERAAKDLMPGDPVTPEALLV